MLQIDPPLRQGQTRYPFLVLQFVKDEETELELNVSDEDFEKKYKDRLKKTYDAPTNVVMSHCLRGLTERKLITQVPFSQDIYKQVSLVLLKHLKVTCSHWTDAFSLSQTNTLYSIQ